MILMTGACVRKTLGLTLMLLTTSGAIGWAQWREEGKVVPDTAWMKSSGNFGAMLFLTDKAEDFFKEWNHEPSPDYRPRIGTVTEARRGGQVASIVLFMGCQPDKDGKCDLEADFRLLRPDKTVYAEEKGVEVWKNKPAPPEPNLQLGQGVFALKVETDDPLGTYTFEAKVRDRVSKIELVLQRDLRVLNNGK
ncbi:MAG TPA: hypothetical protein VFB49_05875 [Patescibacteria group bacterium]|nr:hypothetical protein [Patescibacteria group bacterium]